MTMLARKMLSVQAEPDVAGIRTATFFDEEHTVVPCVALVEGVLWPGNAPAPELALAEEFGRFPEGWNGRPVVLDHPKLNGVPVSASHPDVMEDVAFGQLFNTRLDGKKLKTEIWINNRRVNNMSDDIKKAVDRLTNGDEMIEVSTGLFTMTERASGQYEGEEFSSIWRNVVPDHLAVLPEGIKGACSVEDGCGAPRENHRFVMNAAYIAEGDDVPVDTNTTNQIILSGQGCKTCGGACECDVPEKKGKFQRVMEAFGNVLTFRHQSKDMSDADVRVAISAQLASEEDFFWIMAVFDAGDGTGTFVYESFMENKLFQKDFSITESGVTLSEVKTEVRPVTQFVPVSNAGAMSTQQENSTMNPKDQLVEELIANSATQYSEDDRDWLSTLEESQLAKMSPVVTNDDGGDGDGEALPEAAATAEPEVQEEEEPVVNAAPVSTEDYIKSAPSEIREVLDSGLRMHRERKAQLIGSICENKRNKFTKDQLKQKSLDELEAIASLAEETVSYEGNAPTGASARSSDDDAPPPPPAVFDLNKRSA